MEFQQKLGVAIIVIPTLVGIFCFPLSHYWIHLWVLAIIIKWRVFIRIDEMVTTCRTHICRIRNHSQVVDALDRHGWSASKLWNVALYHARTQWDETGEIPDEGELKDELKTHSKYDGLHSQSSQNVLEELSEAFSS